MIELHSILKYNRSYYIITNIKTFDDYIRVQKCSKTGKLYKYTNAFHVATLQNLFNGMKLPDLELIRRGGDVPVKANIETGIEISKIKRRILFLKNRIKSDTNELEKLTLDINS